MARALVTGAAGFIGRALAAGLEAAGYEVIRTTSADGDVADAATWKALAPVDHVFHLAGRSYVPDSWDEPAAFVATNLCGTMRALEYCKAHGAHLVYVSAYVYGRPARLPIHEDDPVEPNNPYAFSKVLAEQACRFYTETMGVRATVVRPFNIFGPGQRPEFLIPAILDSVRRGVPIRVKDLEPRRDYIFLDDLVDILIKAADVPEAYRVFNAGSGQSWSVRELISAIQSVSGTNLAVESGDERRFNEISDVVADISRAHDLLGWQPKLTLEEGIERLVRNIRA
jgi:nucleoside-diphosphate-sugar epimerase